MALKAKSVAVLCAMASLQTLAACQTLGTSGRPASALLRTDSTEIGVHMSGFSYFAKIGFVFVNTTPKPISRAGCGAPEYPDLEKKVGEKWVPAYYPVYLSCRTIPDFSIPSGGTYRGVLEFMATAPGHKMVPELKVDSIDGTYRLRWEFSEGKEASRDARKVEGISNEFRMVLRQ